MRRGGPGPGAGAGQSPGRRRACAGVGRCQQGAGSGTLGDPQAGRAHSSRTAWQRYKCGRSLGPPTLDWGARAAPRGGPRGGRAASLGQSRGGEAAGGGRGAPAGLFRRPLPARAAAAPTNANTAIPAAAGTNGGGPARSRRAAGKGSVFRPNSPAARPRRRGGAGHHARARRLQCAAGAGAGPGRRVRRGRKHGVSAGGPAASGSVQEAPAPRAPRRRRRVARHPAPTLGLGVRGASRVPGPIVQGVLGARPRAARVRRRAA